MSIRLPPRPPDQRVTAKLQFLADTTPEKFYGDGEGELSIAPPLPLYTTAVMDLKNGLLIRAAKPIAWQYVVFRGSAVIGIAEAIWLYSPPVLTCSAFYPRDVAESLVAAVARAEQV